MNNDDNHMDMDDLNKKLEPSFLFRKAEVKALYIAGYSPKQIAKRFNLKSTSIITDWANQEHWKEERDLVLRKSTDARLAAIMQQQQEALEELQTIKDKAINAIESDTVQPQKFSEATNSYIAALDMERKLKDEGIQISIVMEIAQILKNRITDKKLLMEIASDFRAMMGKHNKALTGGRNNINESAGAEDEVES